MTSLPKLTFSDCARDLGEVIRSFATPPVLLAMNLGALMALKVCEQSNPSALILISPSLPGNLATTRSRPQHLLWLKYRLLIFLGRPFRLNDRDFRANFLTPLPENLQRSLVRQTVLEPSALVREFLVPEVNLQPGTVNCPLLVLAGSEDHIAPAATSKRMTEWLGGEFREYSGQGHWLIENDSENIVRDIHRWAIQKLGERILLADFS